MFHHQDHMPLFKLIYNLKLISNIICNLSSILTPKLFIVDLAGSEKVY